MDCFKLRDANDQDLHRKARLVAGGHLVNILNNDVYLSTVKGITVKLLHMIAHSTGLTALCGDIGNAYVNAYTTEKVYTRADLEFREELTGKIVVIKKAFYGLATLCERFHDHILDALRSMDFLPTRFDWDVWIRLGTDKKSYEYLCTHVDDDFCIFSRHSEEIMQQIQSIYMVNSVGLPEYYLGNDFKRDSKGHWMIGCNHPETDDSRVLGDSDHQKNQKILDMLNWIYA
eukprot:715396-Ditylum_brightwellii.AAC.1